MKYIITEICYSFCNVNFHLFLNKIDRFHPVSFCLQPIIDVHRPHRPTVPSRSLTSNPKTLSARNPVRTERWPPSARVRRESDTSLRGSHLLGRTARSTHACPLVQRTNEKREIEIAARGSATRQNKPLYACVPVSSADK